MTLPDQMTNRWQNRAEPRPGQGTVYWHMLMRDHPVVADLARQARQRLSAFSGLHFTPLQWLHLTTLVAGPADKFSESQLHEMIQIAERLLADTPPVTITLSRIIYHLEAIVLAAKPTEALIPIRDAAQAATDQARGNSPRNCQPPDWAPHVTLCYSTAIQPAQPIIEALGMELPSRDIQVNELSLIIQHGPERDWNWSTVGVIRLPVTASA